MGEGTPFRLLHVVPHLGGGVGRVLSSVAALRRRSGSPVEERFVCLEAPEKSRYVDILREAGVPVRIAPGARELEEEIRAADVVQAEWWNHPLTASWLAGVHGLDMRLVMWSHTSGMHYPAIPEALVAMPHAFLFTTPLSMRPEHARFGNLVAVAHSSGGFDDFPPVSRAATSGPLRCGYLGTLNFAKLHPEILRFLSAVDLPGFVVDFHGDADSNPEWVRKSADPALGGRVRIHGFTDRPDLALRDMDLFVYLLSPLHYGTTENALLEAMACGVVPIVLDNPVERTIVRHGETGLIVADPDGFAQAVAWLHDHPEERLRMSRAGAGEVRRTFALEETERRLSDCYARVLPLPKRAFDFRPVIGTTPASWFLSCAGRYADCFGEGPCALLPPFLFEKSKSSVFHYLRYFAEDSELQRLAGNLTRRNGHVGPS
ncbi:MAG: glycosyltransferase family 4 protein [Magnetococcales bacterium]|nr:glycosyltransferase family 4 protein [Magnetococcales bacterium]